MLRFSSPRRLGDRRRLLKLESLEDRRLLAVFTVTNLDDGPVNAPGDRPGSLRQAVFDANAVAGSDEIIFEEGLIGTLSPTSGEMGITDHLVIDGPGMHSLTIDAQNVSRIFNIGELYSSLDVALSGMTLTGGHAQVGGAIAGIYGTLTVSHCTISGNVSDGAIPRGGGISIYRGNVVIHESILESNRAEGAVGYLVASGGGAVFGAGVTITDSTISGNTTSGLGAFGGGVFAYGGGVEVFNSTISNNSSLNRGHAGGIAAYGNVVMRNSTVTDNHSTVGAGGGVWQSHNFPKQIFVENSVISENSAGGGNPDLRLPGNVTVEIRYSLIGDNSGTSLIESPVGMPDENGNLIGGPTYGVIDALLGPLADNGGSTPTHALLIGSPAIDAGDPSAMAGIGNTPQFDQRGSPFMRVLGGRVDIGAYERLPVTAVDGDFNGDGLFDCLDIDALVQAIAAGGNDLSFDMTGDGLVNLADRDAWLAAAGAANLGAGKTYLLGDATLDGVVDGMDFIVWNQNKFSPLPVVFGWCDANFNADGVVDGLDFIVWNDNKFQSSDGTIEIALPRPSDQHAIAESRRKQVYTDPNVGASSVSPRLVPLTVQHIDWVFATSRRGEDHQDEGRRADSFENLGDGLRINPYVL